MYMDPQDVSVSSEFSGLSLRDMLPSSNEYRFTNKSGFDTNRPMLGGGGGIELLESNSKTTTPRRTDIL